MAARKRSGTKYSPWPDRTRERIRVSMLRNRLEALVEGKVDMPPHAVTAALGLLRKVMPDQASVEHTGDALHPFALLPAQLDDPETWQDAFKPKTEH